MIRAAKNCQIQFSITYSACEYFYFLLLKKKLRKTGHELSHTRIGDPNLILLQ